MTITEDSFYRRARPGHRKGEEILIVEGCIVTTGREAQKTHRKK